MANHVSGWESIASFALETGTLLTPVSIGSGKKVHLAGYNFTINPQGDSYDRYGHPGTAIKTRNAIATGQLSIRPTFNETALIYAALGMMGAGSPVSESGAYRHVFEPDSQYFDRSSALYETNPSEILRRRGTLIINNGGRQDSYASCYFNGVQMTATPVNTLMTFNIVSLRHSPVDNSSIGSWSYPSDSLLSFQNMQLFMKPRNLFTVNGTLLVSDSGGTTTFSFNVSYTGMVLARAIEQALNGSSVLAGYYQVRWDGIDRRFTIQCDREFTLTTGTLNPILGFVNSTTGYTLSSRFAATPDPLTDFDSGDRVLISNVSLSLNNALSLAGRGDGDVIPQGGKMDGSMSITIPRQPNTSGNFAREIRYGEVYCVKLKFTGASVGSNTEELSVIMPCAVVTPNEAVNDFSVAPTNVQIKASAISVCEPNIDMRGDGIHYAEIPSGSTVSALGVFDGHLYFWRSGGNLGRTNMSSVQQTLVTSASLTGACMTGFLRNLYIGMTNGAVYKWDGSSLSNTSLSGAASAILALRVFGHRLYALQTDGKVHSYTGAAWSQLQDYATAYDMAVFGDSLWVMAGGNVYRFNGSSWSTSTTGMGTSTNSRLVVLDNQLFALGGTTAKRFTGSSWVTYSSAISDWTEAFPFMGRIGLIADGSCNAKLYDTINWTAQTITAPDANESNGRPVNYLGGMAVPSDGGGIYFLRPPAPYRIEMVNNISSQPF